MGHLYVREKGLTDRPYLIPASGGAKLQASHKWEQRLKLSDDLVAASNRDKTEVDKQFQAYKSDVAAKGSNASPVKVDAAFQQLKTDDALITHALKAARQATIKSDIEELMKGVNQRLGLVPGLTLNSIPNEKNR
jgi:hypothetical protein